MTACDEFGQMTISVTREQLEEWAGRPLSDADVVLLDGCVPNSSIPEAVGTIVGSFEHDFAELIRDALRGRLGSECDAVAQVRWTGWQLKNLTAQIEPLEYEFDQVQRRYGLDMEGSRYRRVVGYLSDTLDADEDLLDDETVILDMESGEVTRRR